MMQPELYWSEKKKRHYTSGSIKCDGCQQKQQGAVFILVTCKDSKRHYFCGRCVKKAYKTSCRLYEATSLICAVVSEKIPQDSILVMPFKVCVVASPYTSTFDVALKDDRCKTVDKTVYSGRNVGSIGGASVGLLDDADVRMIDAKGYSSFKSKRATDKYLRHLISAVPLVDGDKKKMLGISK